jgi:hypothetical protein
MQLYDWDVMGKEKVATGESQPIKQLPSGQPQDLWVPLKLETAEVISHLVLILECLRVCLGLYLDSSC